MYKKKQTVFTISSLLAFLFLISPILIGQHNIPISVISGGGEKQSNSTYQLWGIANLTSVDKSSSSTYSAQFGFWYEWQIVTDVEEDNNMLPLIYKLEQNYPNPFNPSTIIKFAVPERNSVLIKIYDILGSEVTTLVNEELDAGWYEKMFDAATLSTGVYIYRMKAGNYISTKKMLLIK